MTKVKICGITTIEDARLCRDSGADYLGFNLWPGTPRGIAFETAAAIAEALRARADFPGIVLLDVSPAPEKLLAAVRLVRPAFVQIHGDWNGGEELDGIPVLRAFSLGDERDLDGIERWTRNPILVDAKVAGMHGGTGRLAPRELVKRLKRDYFLAGGLTPENVGEAVRDLHPFAVDTASGVEISPGRKDAEKVRKFVEEARRNG